jgi:hypothetical protein
MNNMELVVKDLIDTEFYEWVLRYTDNNNEKNSIRGIIERTKFKEFKPVDMLNYVLKPLSINPKYSKNDIQSK